MNSLGAFRVEQKPFGSDVMDIPTPMFVMQWLPATLLVYLLLLDQRIAQYECSATSLNPLVALRGEYQIEAMSLHCLLVSRTLTASN